MLTYIVDKKGRQNQFGEPLATGRTMTHDGKFVDSTGAFLVGELERLDLTLHEPLSSVSWARDIDLREDVTLADDVSSYTLSRYASSGSLGTGNGVGNGKAWIGKDTTQIAGVSVDIAKIVQPLRLWGLEQKYTIPELESSARVGRPIDVQKFNVLQLKHQMDIDEQVYIGDTTMADAGLLTSAAVTAVNLTAGATSTNVPWSGKTPLEILTDVNMMINNVWQSSAWSVMPNRMLLPPAVFGTISTQLISNAGNTSILKYIQENNLLTSTGKGRLDIFPCKWCMGSGVGGTIGTGGANRDRAVVYRKEKQLIRYPMTLLQRTPVQYDGIYHKTTYFCKLGVIEVVYPETIGYFDRIS